jgi:uncharacterized membrane protein YkvA (DUF1232 family)
MIVFGVVLVTGGIVIRFMFGDTPLWLMDSHTLGVLLIVLGLFGVLIGVVRRAHRLWARRPGSLTGLEGSGGPVSRLRALPRLVSALRRDAYPGAPRWQPLLWLVAVVYLVSPIDLIPELLPVIGVADDVGVLIWLLTSVFGESGRYITWERTRPSPPADQSRPDRR